MGLFSKSNDKSNGYKRPVAGKPAAVENQYCGVQVVINPGDCCEAARAITGQRFLIGRAPMLPLGDCTAKNCQCSYKRFDDRRAELRRTSDVGFDMASDLHNEENRTNTPDGRRSSDHTLLAED